jgi:GDP/UDP-N,N'-diacetylbacillosamine 2-epimerase (hydrolysing)
LKIALLTSSRADYGIYLPLLKALQADDYFSPSVIAFGSHMSPEHGETIQHIIDDGFTISHQLDTMPEGDNPEDITHAMAKTMQAFVPVWKSQSYDAVVALGDRYEMFAACAASIPFGIPIAHIHGGETTLGSFDDIFRHSLSHMATWHFTAAETYRQRVVALRGSDKNVFNTGALSIDNLVAMSFLSTEAIHKKIGIDLSAPTILITFHPETVGYQKNEQYAEELLAALAAINNYQLIFFMPNTDTMGNRIREKIESFLTKKKNAWGVDAFSPKMYLSCMNHAAMLLGNTSSGFIEAGYFPKYVINIGDRQKGRIVTPNMKNVPIERNAILQAIDAFPQADLNSPVTIYGNGTAAHQMTAILKKAHD